MVIWYNTQSVVMTTTTRCKDQVYLLHGKTTEITGSKLPCIRQALGLFLYQHLDLNKTRREASALVIAKVQQLWNKATIPTRAIQHCQEKLENIFDDWRRLKKNKGRRTETQSSNEAKFCDRLDDLFDIAHANALELIKIPEDREFLIAQREKGRRGCMGSVDVKLYEMEQRRAVRRHEEEKRLCRSRSAMELAASSVTQKMNYQ